MSSISLISISEQIAALAADLGTVKSQLVLVMDKLGVEAPKGKGKRGAKAPKDADAPKRVPNSYMNFCTAKRAEAVAGAPAAKMADISKILGTMWKALTPEQQLAYKTPAATA